MIQFGKNINSNDLPVTKLAGPLEIMDEYKSQADDHHLLLVVSRDADNGWRFNNFCSFIRTIAVVRIRNEIQMIASLVTVQCECHMVLINKSLDNIFI